MLKLKFIERGSYFNVEEGNNSAYYKEGESFILFDCGCTIFSKIKYYKLLEGVKNVYVFITHLHDDHVGSLGSFILYCYYGLGIKPKIYFKQKETIRGFLAYGGAVDGNTYEYMNSTSIDELNITVTAVETSHYEYYKPIEGQFFASMDDEVEVENFFKCYGYYIVRKNDDTHSDSTYYSGDTNYIPKPVVSGIMSLSSSLLYTDTCLPDYEGNGHMSLKRLCNIFPPEFRKQVYCMHLDSDELKEKCIDEGFNLAEVEV